MNKAYSLLTIKQVDDDTRTITGIASTPTPDRMADVVVPEGAQYKLPLPLLWQHDPGQPIGSVTSAKVTSAGIEIVAQIASGVSAQIDQAWALIKAGLVRGLSIGFRGLDMEQIPNSWGVIFQKWEWLELSAVTIPANAEASITSVKRYAEKADADWKVGASRSLAIDDSDSWDGPAAEKRIFADAGFDGDSPNTAKAAKAFLVYDAANPKLKGSYKLPFADIVGGELKAVAGGLRAASSRLPQTDIPDAAQKSAKGVLDAYFAKINGDKPKAASGHNNKSTPGVTGNGAIGFNAKRHKPVNLTISERSTMADLVAQIAALEAKRAANAARMEEVMQKSIDEGRSSDEAEQEEFDALEVEVKAIDSDLTRLKRMEALKKAQAKPVADVVKEGDGTGARAGVSIKVKENLAPGIRFARVVKCLGLAKGNLMHAEQIAMKAYERDEAVVNTMKAAVAAGVTSSGWGQNLVGEETSVFADFVEFLRPQTILGKFGAGNVPGLRAVPFRTALIGQTSGGEGYWVGEGKPKPLTNFTTSRTTLDPLKVANIAVATMELLRDSSPSAEILIRDTLASALRERLDIDFIDPAKTASAGVSPASITNGVSAIHSSGNDAASVREDIRQLFGQFIAANNAPTSGVWIMAATTALALSLMQNPLGQPEFPGISMNGGTLFGLPVIVSEYVPTVSAGSYVMLVNAQDVYLADEGGITVDMSNQASLEMKDGSLTQDATAGTGTSLVSLWQTNAVGFLAERTINWAKRRASAVAVLDEVNWGVPGS